MSVRTPLFRKVTIVGVGLIGGSLGMAIKKRNLAREVVGVSQKNSTLVYALKSKVIDRAEPDVKKAVSNADLVILATPVNTIMQLFSTIAPRLKRNCIVTDVGSAKVAIVDKAEKALPPSVFFIGSHPLAGSEKKGANYANADLFKDALCILTPTDKTNRLAKDKIKHFWTSLGSKVEFLSPDAHDKTLAYISHLPHLLAYGLMETIPPENLPYAAQGLKDTTRIASSSPQMWKDIFLTNSKNIIKTLDELAVNLAAIRKSIISKDERSLTNYFQKAKAKRDDIGRND